MRLPETAPRNLVATEMGDFAHLPADNKAEHSRRVEQGRSQDLYALAGEYSAALGRSVTYVDVPRDEWRDQELRSRGLPEHVFDHLLTMAHLHAANSYDRLSPHVETILGRPPRSLESMVQENREMFNAG